MRSKKEGIITIDAVNIDKNTINLSIFVKDVSLSDVDFPIKSILYDSECLQVYDEPKVSFRKHYGNYITSPDIDSDRSTLHFMAYAPETEIDKLSKFNKLLIDQNTEPFLFTEDEDEEDESEVD